MTKLQRGRWAHVGWALVVALCVSASATAQVFTGRIDTTVQDGTGAVLPGVTVEVTGPQNQNTVTDAQGEAHFLNLPPGALSGEGVARRFRRLPESSGDGWCRCLGTAAHHADGRRRDRAGAGLDRMPVVDPKRDAVSTTITNAELQNIPSSRDPWVVLQTVPGIIVDRVNVGGSRIRTTVQLHGEGC